MSLSSDEVRHVARLARIALTDEEVTALAPELSRILDYAAKVSEVAGPDVVPTSHPYPLVNVLRSDDEVALPLDPDVVVANAPDAVDRRFRVPRIVADQA